MIVSFRHEWVCEIGKVIWLVNRLPKQQNNQSTSVAQNREVNKAIGNGSIIFLMSEPHCGSVQI